MVRSLTFAAALLATPFAAHAGLDVRPDVEVDPMAYALGGHSVHVGVGLGAWRLDLGAFAIETPEWFHGNEGVDLYSSGFGLKVDRYFGDDAGGLHVGLGTEVLRESFTGGGAATERTVLLAGGRIGWRFLFGDTGFYADPWVGVSYAFGGGDAEVGGRAYERGEVVFFPTVHLGYRFD